MQRRDGFAEAVPTAAAVAAASVSAAKRVAIVGAGCSGLASVKCCLDDGLEPHCFEMSDDLGGLWNYTERTPASADADRLHASVYESCTINTSKEMMAFSDYPTPAGFAPFMPHRQVLKYFRMYAEHFRLLPWIRFNARVERVEPAPQHAVSGAWTVRWLDATTGERRAEEFDAVMVCSGHHRRPHVPPVPGLERFEGLVLHSADYKQSTVFKGKRVLVVGLGNSGADIATDASYVAEEVHASTHKGAWIFSRFFPGGYPADAIANSRLMFALPRSLLQWAVERLCIFRYSGENYGLQATHRGLEAHPTIHDILLVLIMSGLVKVKPAVERFTKDGVYYADGTYQQLDVVVMATGYDISFPFLSDEILYGPDRKSTVDAYKFTFLPHLERQTLALIGLAQPVGAIMPISELQARWFARLLTGKVQLPSASAMYRHIEERNAWVSKNMATSRRHHLETFWIKAMDEIADEIGVRPQMTRLLFDDPLLALRCIFGPCVPAQYRLFGHGKWDGARAVIEHAFQNMAAPTRTRVVRSATPTGRTSHGGTVQWKMVILRTLLFAAVLLLLANVVNMALSR